MKKAAWFLIAVYISMLLGMAAKTFFNHFTRQDKLEIGSFMVPLLISPLVYGTVFNIVKNSSETVMMLIFGFQNGFFWQDVLGTITKNNGESHQGGHQ